MTKYEDFVAAELAPQLAPGESIVHTAFLFNKSLVGFALFGALAALTSGYFFAAATDRRLFLMKMKMGIWSLKSENLGITEIPYETITKIEPGGMLNQRSITISTTDGSSFLLRLNTLARYAGGQKTFIESLPKYVATRRA